MKKWVMLALLALGGCATTISGIEPVGQDAFLITAQAGAGVQQMGTLKADVMSDANVYCDMRGKVVKVLEVRESQPPHVLGTVPRVVLKFTCE